MSWEQRTIVIPYHHALPGCLAPRFDGVIQTKHPFGLSCEEAENPPLDLLRKHRHCVALIPGCPLLGPPSPLRWVDGFLRYVPTTFPHYYHRLGDSFESFLKKHTSKNRRKRFRKIVRDFERDFGCPVRWRVFRGASGFDEFSPLAWRISRQTYQAQRLGLGLPEGQDFIRDVRLKMSVGECVGALLYAGEQPVSFLLAYIDEGHVFRLEYGGYVPEYRDWSPGTLLDYLLIEHMYDGAFPGVDTVDLTQGEGHHKSTFATDQKLAGDVYFFQACPEHIAFVYSHWNAWRWYRGCSQWLKAKGLDARVRRLIRRERK